MRTLSGGARHFVEEEHLREGPIPPPHLHALKSNNRTLRTTPYPDLCSNEQSALSTGRKSALLAISALLAGRRCPLPPSTWCRLASLPSPCFLRPSVLAALASLPSLPSPRCPRLPALALLHTPLAAILSIGCHHLAAMTQLASPCSRRVAPVASPLSPRCPHLAALALLCSPRCAHLAVLTLLPSSCPARRAPPGSSRMQEHRLQGVSWRRLARRAASSSWTCVAVRSTAHADGPAHP